MIPSPDYAWLDELFEAYDLLYAIWQSVETLLALLKGLF